MTVASSLLAASGTLLPVGLVLVVREQEKMPLLALLIVLLALGTVVLLALQVRAIRVADVDEVEVRDVSSRALDIVIFALTLLPAIAVAKLDDSSAVLAVAMSVALFLLVALKGDIGYINPLVFVPGFGVYEIETTVGDKFTLVCRRRRLDREDKVRVYSTTSNVRLAAGWRFNGRV